MNDQTCAQCQTSIPAGMGIATDNAVFCEPCYEKLAGILESSLARQGRNINYPGAVGGGLAGGLLAAGVWWGFTILTKVQFGLVAVLIGWAVGKGVVTMSGGKRALPLQFISVVITVVSYFLANYWVNRTFILRYFTENGMAGELPFFPDLTLLAEITFSGFEIWDIVFLAIALWQAWKGPAPIVLRKAE